jgi:catechol 2,3-dioxygenase-like lactoylglutathione lyase family enzyme
MAILGLESVVFGVDDVDTCSRFWSDLGLSEIGSPDTNGQRIFEVESGSRVIVRLETDHRLPPRNFEGNGLRMTMWGVDTQASLETLVAGIAVDQEVRRDADGAAFFQAPDGQHLGLRVWAKRPVISRPDAVNAPDNIQRLNQHRQWRHKAIPKTINHVVFFSPDYVGSYEFYRDKLNFRYSDHSKGVGVFARADGTNEHHSIFWINSDLPFSPGGHAYMHIAFGMDDIDEVMLGANIMEKKGWRNTSNNSSGGVSRHRISSAIYYYVDNPNGGEAEYHCDTDYLNDNWIPRAWDFKFGSLLWSTNTPPQFRGDNIPWDVTFDKDEHSLDPYRKGNSMPGAEERAALTAEDEHAL